MRMALPWLYWRLAWPVMFVCSGFIATALCQSLEMSATKYSSYQADIKHGYFPEELAQESTAVSTFSEMFQDPRLSLDISDTARRGIFYQCYVFLHSFANHSSAFTKCLVRYARPLRFCEECVIHFKKATTVYEDLNKCKNCSSFLLDADRIHVLRLVYKNMENVWSKADCHQCFDKITENENGTVNFTLSNSTEKFLDLFGNISQCFNTTIEVTFAIPRNVCKNCKKQYQKLNIYFEDILKTTNQHACMDIVDMMNYTRLMWSRKYHCSHRSGDLGPVLGIMSFFCLLPIAFYVGNRVYGARQNRQIVRQKRMRRPRVESLYGSVADSRDSSLFDSTAR